MMPMKVQLCKKSMMSMMPAFRTNFEKKGQGKSAVIALHLSFLRSGMHRCIHDRQLGEAVLF